MLIARVPLGSEVLLMTVAGERAHRSICKRVPHRSWSRGGLTVQIHGGGSGVEQRRTWNGVAGKLNHRREYFRKPFIATFTNSQERAHILEVESNLFAAENEYIAKALEAAVERFQAQRAAPVDFPRQLA